MICWGCQVLQLKTLTNRLEELAHKLYASSCLYLGRYPVRYDPVTGKDGRSIHCNLLRSCHFSCQFVITIFHLRHKLVPAVVFGNGPSLSMAIHLRGLLTEKSFISLVCILFILLHVQLYQLFTVVYAWFVICFQYNWRCLMSYMLGSARCLAIRR